MVKLNFHRSPINLNYVSFEIMIYNKQTIGMHILASISQIRLSTFMLLIVIKLGETADFVIYFSVV